MSHQHITVIDLLLSISVFAVDDIGPQEILVARVLLRNLEILQFNAHEISETIRPKDSTTTLKTINIGVGLYKSASYFNHECFPAVAR